MEFYGGTSLVVAPDPFDVIKSRDTTAYIHVHVVHVYTCTCSTCACTHVHAQICMWYVQVIESKHYKLLDYKTL